MNAIITGSNRGIGNCMVHAFAEKGYDIWACARRQNDEFEREMRELSERTGREITPIYFDLSSEDELKKGVKEILAAKKPIDVLINNAGMIYGATMNMLPLGKLEEVFRVNVFAQVQMMQLVSRRMIAQKSGRIINMCSALGMEIAPGSLAYGSSKAALIWITKLAAAELGEYNINVNGIAPGYIDTDMGRTNDNQREVIEKTVLKRLGTPAEVADTALFLASPESSFMTGQIISVDGGRLL